MTADLKAGKRVRTMVDLMAAPMVDWLAGRMVGRKVGPTVEL
jgi:hypothetical protein